MKSEINAVYQGFQPVQVKITFESARELGIALALFNRPQALVDYLSGKYVGELVSGCATEKELDLLPGDTWEELHDYWLANKDK